MKYQDYIDLGFKRIDIDDEVEFRQSGYGGFVLTRQINEKMAVEVSSSELDNPLLIISKVYSEGCHRVAIKPKVVADIFTNLKQ